LVLAAKVLRASDGFEVPRADADPHAAEVVEFGCLTGDRANFGDP